MKAWQKNVCVFFAVRNKCRYFALPKSDGKKRVLED
jgi:hypothetical protein